MKKATKAKAQTYRAVLVERIVRLPSSEGHTINRKARQAFWSPAEGVYTLTIEVKHVGAVKELDALIFDSKGLAKPLRVAIERGKRGRQKK